MSVKVAFDVEELPLVLRKLRKIAGLSQQEVALLAGVGKTMVYDLEKGQKRASLENLLKVLKVLNVKIELKSPVEMEIDK